MSVTKQQPLAVRERFSQNLRRIRLEHKLSQEDLANLAEMHRTEISALERGKREPRLRTLIRLSAVLEVPLDKFFEGIEWTPLEVPIAPPGRFSVSPLEKNVD